MCNPPVIDDGHDLTLVFMIWLTPTSSESQFCKHIIAYGGLRELETTPLGVVSAQFKASGQLG